MANPADSTTTLVKVCGLTLPDEARRVLELGAHWVGLNFHPASKRFVSLARAAEIVAALPDRRAAVALFVDRPPDEIWSIVEWLGIGTVQLHGVESFDDVRRLRSWNLQVVRAFRLGDRDDVLKMREWLREADARGSMPNALLLDAKVSGQAGGTGQVVPVDLLSEVWEVPLALPVILAGGLNGQNVGPLVRRWRPWMVDVASGVERAPGRKDLGKVAEFLEAARIDHQTPGINREPTRDA